MKIDANLCVRSPKEIGDKIKKRRLELGLFQREVAAIIGVSVDCLRNWEHNRAKPHITYYPKITTFLGYFPLEITTRTFAQKVTSYRYLNGLTQEELARCLTVNESTIFRYEKYGHFPSRNILRKLEKLLMLK